MTAGRGTLQQAVRGCAVAVLVSAAVWVGLVWAVIQAARGLG